MRQVKKFVAGGVAAAGMVFASPASALIVEWNANYVNEFTVATLWNGGNASGVGTNQIRWGVPFAPNTFQSGLDVSSPVDAQVFTNDPAVNTVSITHLNRVIGCTRGNPATGLPAANGPICLEALKDATIESTLTLSAIDPALGEIFSDSLDFEIRFAETVNLAANCLPGDASVCDDVFALISSTEDLLFALGPIFDGTESRTYFVQIGIENLAPLGAAACGRVDLAANCVGFKTPEGQDTTIFANIRIFTADVPEPGILATLALALMAAGIGIRRKHA